MHRLSSGVARLFAILSRAQMCETCLRSSSNRFGRSSVFFTRFVCFVLLVVFGKSIAAQTVRQVRGLVTDPQGTAVAEAHIVLTSRAASSAAVRETNSDAAGRFAFVDVPAGDYTLTAAISSFAPANAEIVVAADETLAEVTLQFREVASLRQAVTVVGDSAPSALTPDPSQHVVVHDQVLDANPGRPGVPVSIPGLPVRLRLAASKPRNISHPA
jgi:hypothetical protein